jgi:uncharacterized membrane protein
VDYRFNFAPYYAALFAAGIVFYHQAQKDVLLMGPIQLAILWGAVILTFGALFFSLYAVWSPVGADIVSGLQGRYFIGLLPFLILAVAQTAALVGRERLLKVAATILFVVILHNIFRAVDLRYY